MEIYEGVAAFPGIAIGQIRYYVSTKESGYPHAISDVKQELNRYHRAKEKTLEQLKELYSQAVPETKEADTGITK